RARPLIGVTKHSTFSQFTADNFSILPSQDNGNTHLPEVIRPWISRCLQQKERIYWYQSIQGNPVYMYSISSSRFYASVKITLLVVVTQCAKSGNTGV
ncbi:hypothetical protein STEG23_011484, partial [Scotinomys teguina]